MNHVEEVWVEQVMVNNGAAVRPLISDIPTEISPRDLGLLDANISGWYSEETGEMFTGFPVTIDDVFIDVGCGDGGPASFSARHGAEVILTDINPDKVAAAESRCRSAGARKVTALVSDSVPLPIEDQRGTRILCSEVLEHVDDPERVLIELVRIGKPGALYLITVPDPVCEEMQKHLAPPTYFMRPNHVRVFSRESFGSLIERSGLIIEQRHFYGFFWSMWWLLFWSADVSLDNPRHPLLDQWIATWTALLNTKDGVRVKHVFDRLMPKSQVIVARKSI